MFLILQVMLDEYRAVLLLDENSCFLSTVLRTNFKEEYKAVMLLDENSCFLSTVLRTLCGSVAIVMKLQ